MGISFEFSLLRTPALMGIVNVAPNSFSDTGEHFKADAAMDHARSLANQGAQIIDVGAEASSFFRPGVAPVPAEEQMNRLRPVLSVMKGVNNTFISIDTRSALVARETISRGAHIINDISAGTYDEAMLDTVAKSGAAIILMHTGSTFPDTPQSDDPDVLGTVYRYLGERVEAAERAGIRREKIAIDPGLGFGKTPADNWMLALIGWQELLTLGVPIVLGASRKRFLETSPPPRIAPNWQRLVDSFSGGAHVHPRDPASAALTYLASRSGISVHRVHNVALAEKALSM